MLEFYTKMFLEHKLTLIPVSSLFLFSFLESLQFFYFAVLRDESSVQAHSHEIEERKLRDQRHFSSIPFTKFLSLEFI